MKPVYYILISIFILTIIGCSKSQDGILSKKNSNTDISKYFKLSKNRDCTLSKRIGYIDKVYVESMKQGEDSIALRSLSYKVLLHKKNKESDSVLLYAHKMLSLAQKTDNHNQIGRAYFKIAEYYRNKNKNDSAYYFLNESKNIFIELKDSVQVGKKLNIMGRILIDDSDYFSGETTLIEALEYLEPKIDSVSLINVYFNLSIALRKQFNYKQALEKINKAIKLNKSTKSGAILINTKALTLRERKEYRKAIKLYDSLSKSKSVIENKKEYARVIDNLAYTQWLSNNFLNVEDKLIEALNIRKSKNDIQGLIASNSHLMKYYSNKNELKAMEHANELYELTVEQNNTEDRLDALYYLSHLSATEVSKAYSNLYIKIKDSITKARDIAKNKYAAIRYDSTKDRETALKLETQLAKSNLQKSNYQIQLLALAILLIITSSIGIFINYRRKQQTKIARIEERHKTNNRLSKKLHDEVGNDLYYLLLQLQKVSGFTSDQENLKILKGFDTVYHKLRDFSRDHKIETGEEYGDELLSLLDSYGDENTKVITSELETSFWTEVSPLKKEELYWVLKELLTNMKKHSQATIVAVTFAKEKKKITVNYIDNGIGTNLKKTISKNGLSNVEIRMKDIGGTITFDSKPEEGFKANIVFTP